MHFISLNARVVGPTITMSSSAQNSHISAEPVPSSGGEGPSKHVWSSVVEYEYDSGVCTASVQLPLALRCT